MPNTAICYNNSLTHNQSTTSNYSFYLLRDLSSTAKYLYIELHRVAGPKGYLSYSVTDLSEIVGRSIKQTRRLLHELEANGLLDIWLHPGRESEYVIPDVYFRGTLDKKVHPFKKKSNIKKTVREQRPNGASLSIVKTDPKIQPRSVQAQTAEQTSRFNGSQQNNFQSVPIDADPHEAPDPIAHDKIASEPVIKPDTHIIMGDTPTRAKSPIRMDVVREIIQLTNDHKSIGFWVKMVKTLPLLTVYYCIASLKSELESDRVIAHRGKYLTAIFKNQAPELFQNPKQALSQPQDAPTYSKPPQSDPMIERDWQINLANIRNIQQILDKSSRRKEIV